MFKEEGKVLCKFRGVQSTTKCSSDEWRFDLNFSTRWWNSGKLWESKLLFECTLRVGFYVNLHSEKFKNHYKFRWNFFEWSFMYENEDCYGAFAKYCRLSVAIKAKIQISSLCHKLQLSSIVLLFKFVVLGNRPQTNCFAAMSCFLFYYLFHVSFTYYNLLGLNLGDIVTVKLSNSFYRSFDDWYRFIRICQWY